MSSGHPDTTGNGNLSAAPYRRPAVGEVCALPTTLANFLRLRKRSHKRQNPKQKTTWGKINNLKNKYLWIAIIRVQSGLQANKSNHEQTTLRFLCVHLHKYTNLCR